MSPSVFNGSYVRVFRVYSDGQLASDRVGYTCGVRPVINLRADVTLTGTGTSIDPYVVS